MFTNRSLAAAFSSARLWSLCSLVSAVDGGGPFGNGGGPPGGGPPGGGPPGGAIGGGIVGAAGDGDGCSFSVEGSSPSCLSPIINTFSSSSSSFPVKNPIMRSNSVSSAFISTLSPVGPTKTPVSLPSNLFCGIPYAVFILTTSTFASLPCGQS